MAGIISITVQVLVSVYNLFSGPEALETKDKSTKNTMIQQTDYMNYLRETDNLKTTFNNLPVHFSKGIETIKKNVKFSILISIRVYNELIF